MRDIWITSDTHFGHENIIKYCNRPFANAAEMDEALIENWNKTVKPKDIIYHLGDVYFGKDGRNILSRLHGDKRLILGNHDNGKDQSLIKHFQKILVWRMFPEFGILLSHVPLHQDSLRCKAGPLVNVHGHTHDRKIGYHIDTTPPLPPCGELFTSFDPLPTIKSDCNVTVKWIDDSNYKNVCVEQTNYTPVHIETLRVVK